jgi:alpha-tubulin suppressor-like RCC1 family protein
MRFCVKMGLAVMTASGCAGVADGDGVGRAAAEVANTPPGVQCVRVEFQYSDGVVEARQGATTPSASSRLDLGPLRAGAATLRGSAYESACEGLLPPSGDPTWIASPTSVTVVPGSFQVFPLVFRPNSPAAVKPDYRIPVRSLGAGPYTTYAVMADGTARAWGSNRFGQGGLGSITGALRRPSPVVGLRGSVGIGGGEAHACAITNGGEVYCWGRNDLMQIGDATTAPRLVPERVVPLSQAATLSVGANHACVYSHQSEGVECWGSNNEGQRGEPAGPPRPVPYPALAGLPITAVSAGATATCALLGSGAVRCASENDTWLPTLTSAPAAFPRTLPGVFESLSVGVDRACGVTATGQVTCAGLQTSSNLDGPRVVAAIPSSPIAGLTQVTRVVAGEYFTCALRADGTVWCLGPSSAHVTGDPTQALPSNVARPVVGLTGVTDLVAGARHACALRADGSVWCWGDNRAGQLGDGTLMSRFRPVPVLF